MNDQTNTEPTKPVPVFENRKQEIIAEIWAIEANQSRAVREAALGDKTRLQEMDDRIKLLREEMAGL